MKELAEASRGPGGMTGARYTGGGMQPPKRRQSDRLMSDLRVTK